ncbi:hypothetical protein QCE63_30450 [Caballeronia sp. LZ065]|uniref:hypothetical protein n=1 Tax=Caballeronia sp. LZ065 TaxID=3038571 RepID=UPI002864BA25|nr:hypothetical protein [Caballeronia sp. LZ065]MDR5783740.1 hypothetical protein [Caballeronia sp. LZ065]
MRLEAPEGFDDDMQRLLIEPALLCEAHDGVQLLARATESCASRRSLIFLVRVHGNPFSRTFPRQGRIVQRGDP